VVCFNSIATLCKNVSNAFIILHLTLQIFDFYWELKHIQSSYVELTAEKVKLQGCVEEEFIHLQM